MGKLRGMGGLLNGACFSLATKDVDIELEICYYDEDIEGEVTIEDDDNDGTIEEEGARKPTLNKKIALRSYRT